MGDRHPAALLALPHGHHGYAFDVDRLTRQPCSHGEAVGDDEVVAIGTDVHISQSELFHLQLLQVRQGLFAIADSIVTDPDIGDGHPEAEFLPMFRFYLCPPQTLELLCASRVRPGTRTALPTAAASNQ